MARKERHWPRQKCDRQLLRNALKTAASEMHGPSGPPHVPVQVELQQGKASCALQSCAVDAE
eukprot:4318905-Lingulodinium_polyedra.AAC.1